MTTKKIRAMLKGELLGATRAMKLPRLSNMTILWERGVVLGYLQQLTHNSSPNKIVLMVTNSTFKNIRGGASTNHQ